MWQLILVFDKKIIFEGKRKKNNNTYTQRKMVRNSINNHKGLVTKRYDTRSLVIVIGIIILIIEIYITLLLSCLWIWPLEIQTQKAQIQSQILQVPEQIPTTTTQLPLQIPSSSLSSVESMILLPIDDEM